MIDIKTLSLQQIEEIIEEFGEKPFRAKQVFQWLWLHNVCDFEQMKNISKNLREYLQQNFSINTIRINQSIQSQIDQTIKYTFTTYDNKLIEGVLIPSKKEKFRVTACISTQVGCQLNCSFCATGQMGFARNLTKAEIYEQVYLLNTESIEKFGYKLSNIVVMGMGEPLLNFENLLGAVDSITSPNLLGMSPSRITVSTAGLAQQIKELADLQPKFNLAISLHSAIDKIRNEIMPINRSNNIQVLIDALKYYNNKTQQRITIEYLMLDSVNDTIEDAKALALFCRNFPVKINLIQFNSVEHSQFSGTPMKNIQNFYDYLAQKNIVVTIRHSKGKDIDAACGQLANKKIKK